MHGMSKHLHQCILNNIIKGFIMITKLQLLMNERKDNDIAIAELTARNKAIMQGLLGLAPTGAKEPGIGTFTIAVKTDFDWESACKDNIAPWDLASFEITEIIPEQKIVRIDYESIARAKDLDMKAYITTTETPKFTKAKESK
jgi:hypothetical protein